MSSFVDYYFGPLSKDYCMYFFLLSVIGFVSLVLFLISTVMIGLSKRKGSEFYLHSFFIALGIGLYSYFQNRLLYSMCVGKV
jgi:hypothetical protein